MRVHTIQGVLDELDGIIERCHDRGSRLGFFPALYRKTTAEVLKGVETGRFEDPERMERFDAMFAERYIEAFEQHERGERPTATWEHAFVMSSSPDLAVVQHLLLGMNAHINLDLGISAADVAPGPELDSLKRDFDEINSILGDMVDGVQTDLSIVCPMLRVIDCLCLRFDEAAVSGVITHSRTNAWKRAVALTRCSSAEERQRRIGEFDGQTVLLARRIAAPDAGPSRMSFFAERDMDVVTIRRVIEGLVD